MGIFHFSQIEILAFILVLIRVSVFIALWPVFGIASVPAFAKILTALVISMLIFPTIHWHQVETDLSSNLIIWMAAKEVFISLVFVSIARMLFYAVQVCGQIVTISMGLSSAEIFSAATETRASSVEQFQLMLCSLFFLAMNGHHMFLSAFVDSFDILPLSTAGLTFLTSETLGILIQKVMTVGIQLAAPVLASIFFMNVAMGLVSRAVPQINILVTSFPVNILTGFLVLLITIPAFFVGFKDFINETGMHVIAIMKSL